MPEVSKALTVDTDRDTLGRPVNNTTAATACATTRPDGRQSPKMPELAPLDGSTIQPHVQDTPHVTA